MKTITIWTTIISVLLIGGILFFTQKKENTILPEEVLSSNGLHWHSNLSIFINEEKLEIPSDIGLGVTHNPVHTHDPDGVIHLEFSGRVTKDDTRLGEFFKNWNRNMRSFGENMRMTVNGIENEEFENYHMQDGDNIELYYD